MTNNQATKLEKKSEDSKAGSYETNKVNQNICMKKGTNYITILFFIFFAKHR